MIQQKKMKVEPSWGVFNQIWGAVGSIKPKLVDIGASRLNNMKIVQNFHAVSTKYSNNFTQKIENRHCE